MSFAGLPERKSAGQHGEDQQAEWEGKAYDREASWHHAGKCTTRSRKCGAGARPKFHSFLYGHCACVNNAPSIQMVCPLMKCAPWLARKTTVGAISVAVPTRPSGVSL